MSDESKRQKRKNAREGAQKLARMPGWDPQNFKSADPIEKLRELETAERGDAAYAQADVCAACEEARKDSGDETALCEKHLADAMGF